MMERRERLLRSIYERKRLARTLGIFSTCVSLLVALAFVFLLAALVFWKGDYKQALKLIFTTGIPFLGVGLARKLIGAKRPYEVFDFFEKSPKGKLFGSGKSEGSASFPSRHAYSSFVISTAFVFFNPWLGACLGVLSALMCVCRVLLGIHFIRDVIAGAAVGAVCAVLGEFLIRI